MAETDKQAAAAAQARKDNVSPEIEWKNISGRECLYFKFGIFLTYDAAEKAVEKWKDEFSKNPGQKISIVWDCLNMQGYDKHARVIWQDTIKELGDRIDCIWIITKSIMISVGASVIGTVTKLKINTCSNADEIKFKNLGT